MTLYQHLCLPKELFSSWRSVYSKKSKEKKKRGKDINGLTLADYKKSEEVNVNQLANALQRNEYSTDKLKAFYRMKPGKTTKRLIGISSINDRIIHKRILTIISPYIIPYIKNGVSFGCVSKGKIKEDFDSEPVGIKGAMRHLVVAISNNNHWVFKSDIEAFYDSINKEKMYQKIISLLPDASLNTILREFIYFKWGNPEIIEDPSILAREKAIAQGPALSPMFSNVYLIDFDKEMKDKYQENFIRYADDFIIVCKTEKEAEEAKLFAEKILKIDYLNLSPDKDKTYITNIRAKPLIFLGLKVTRQKILFKKTPGELKTKLDSLLNKDINTKSKILKVNQYVRGIYESYKYYHCINFFIELNKILLNKKKQNKFAGLKLLNLTKDSTIVPQKVWQLYFEAT